MSENTEVTNVDSGVISAGESPISFNEFESMGLGADKAKTSSEKKEPKQTKDGEYKDASSKEKSSTEEEKSSQKSEKIIDDKNQKSQGVDKKTPPGKIIKVKAGESEIDLDAGALVPVKVDGKIEMIPVEQVINGYSGQSSLTKKFNEFRKNEAALQKQQQLLNDRLQKAYDSIVTAKDLRSFSDLVAEVTGKDAQEIYTSTMESMQQQIEEFNTLTPEERRIKELEREANYWKSKEELNKQNVEQQAKLAEAQEAYEVIQNHFGLETEEMSDHLEALVSSGVEKNALIEQPEIFVNYMKNFKAIDQADSILKQYKDKIPQLQSKEGYSQFVVECSKYLKENGVEALENLVGQIAEKTPIKKINKKIEKSQEASAAQKQVKNPGSDPLFFSDLDY